MRPPLVLPKDPNHSIVTFLFRNASSYPNKPALIDAETSETLTFSQLKSTIATSVTRIAQPRHHQKRRCPYLRSELNPIPNMLSLHRRNRCNRLNNQPSVHNPRTLQTSQGLEPKVSYYRCRTVRQSQKFQPPSCHFRTKHQPYFKPERYPLQRFAKP